jgi:hypothetical protein
MAPISHLPSETLIEIMKFCDQPQNMLSVIKAAPIFLQHFIAHRNQLMRPIVDDLKSHFPGYGSPMCLSALQLRHGKQSGQWLELSTREAEAANLNLYRPRDPPLQLSTSTNLTLLCRISELLTETEWILSTYSPQAWFKMQVLEMEDYPRRGHSFPTELVLSEEEKVRFIHASIHFDVYCQLFFLVEEILFKRNSHVRHLFFDASHKNGVTTRPFYSIVYYIFD